MVDTEEAGGEPRPEQKEERARESVEVRAGDGEVTEARKGEEEEDDGVTRVTGAPWLHALLLVVGSGRRASVSRVTTAPWGKRGRGWG